MVGERLSAGDASYTWIEGWAPPAASVRDDSVWAHHGLVASGDRGIVGFQSGGGALSFLDGEGRLVECVPTGLLEGHGLTLTGPAGDERLWVADPGLAFVADGGGGYELHAPHRHGDVVLLDLTGRRLFELPTPDLPAYEAGSYRPTAVAVDDGPDGDGAIWVADGYGEGAVHRFSRAGELQLTLTGEEGAGRFDCPHTLLIDRRAERPRLYVTDRGNGRLQIYDLSGGFLDEVSEGLISPTALAAFGDELIVAELDARVTILDRDDRIAGHLGRDDAAPEREGWPNAVAADGRTVRPPDLRAGRFNSPHGLAVDADGDLYVSEWMIGGRLVRLARER